MKLTDLQNLMDELALQQSKNDEVLSADREQEIQEALPNHPEWMEEMRTRDNFDRHLRHVLAESPSTHDRKAKLLSLIAETPAASDSSYSIPAQPATSHQRSRRRALGLITASTLMFAVAIGIILSSLSPALSVAQVQDSLPQLWDRSTEELMSAHESASIQADLPTGEWNQSRIRYEEDWQPVRLKTAADQVAAFRKFSFRSDRGVTHQGLLLSLPTSRFSAEQRPAATSPFSADIRYLSPPSGLTLAIVSWSDAQTDSVYFLAVPAETRTLDALDALMYVNPV
ncbi:MAG: hypothetical protein HUJ26_23095 [Planctomycetaceae bacterium]|nr:hypothetical protein [Planctomycetaceae bacterium]